jgi:mono/diheme cytochrome c family protein
MIIVKIKILSVYLTVLLVVLSCASRKSEPVKGRIFTAANVSITNGEKVFMAKCQKCHPGGEAGLGAAINSIPAPGFVKKFQIRHGLGAMPSFKKGEISKRDLDDLGKYMRAWKRY